MADKYLGNKEMAAKLGMSLSTWYTAKHSGEYIIPFVRPNRWRESTVDQWIADQEKASVQAQKRRLCNTSEADSDSYAP